MNNTQSSPTWTDPTLLEWRNRDQIPSQMNLEIAPGLPGRDSVRIRPLTDEGERDLMLIGLCAPHREFIIITRRDLYEMVHWTENRDGGRRLLVQTAE